MKSKTTALILSIFFGGLGVDRFYLGYTGMRVLKLLTGGGFGVLYILDIINIAISKLKPANGSRYNNDLDPAQPTTSVYDELEKVTKLHESGVLSDEEFNKMKADLLDEYEKNNSILRYVAGACFAGAAVLVLINLVQRVFDDNWTLLCLVGYALIAVSLFTSLPILTSVGAGAVAVTAIRTLIIYFSYIKVVGFEKFPKPVLFTAILFLAYLVLLIIVGINKKSAKQLSFVAGGVAVLSFAILMIGIKETYESLFGNDLGWLIYSIEETYGSFGLHLRYILKHMTIGNGLDSHDILMNILPIVGEFMIGMSADCSTTKASTDTNVATSTVESSTPKESD